jgi:hypothetical protein
VDFTIVSKPFLGAEKDLDLVGGENAQKKVAERFPA